MFSFFQKKHFLADHLSDFTDIHNHILPGIDDGAANVEISYELVRNFEQIGVRNFIATPHVMNDYYPNTPETINTALEELRGRLQTEGKEEIKLRAAAEYMMDQTFLELMQNQELLTLVENYVLVEMSYFQPPINLNAILFKLQTLQYKPVLAHPERYAFFHTRDLSKYEELKDRGCLLQLNLLSLTGHYGKHIQSIASELTRKNMIDFLGTDAHQTRHLEKIQSIRLSSRSLELLQPIIKRTGTVFKIS